MPYNWYTSATTTTTGPYGVTFHIIDSANDIDTTIVYAELSRTLKPLNKNERIINGNVYIIEDNEIDGIHEWIKLRGKE